MGKTNIESHGGSDKNAAAMGRAVLGHDKHRIVTQSKHAKGWGAKKPRNIKR